MKKKLIISAFVITILIVITYFMSSSLIDDFYNQNSNKNTFKIEKFPPKEPFVYIGDEGYGFVVKGKLLKKEFEKDYNKLPDTLCKMEFSDYLYPVDINADYYRRRYSLIEYNTMQNINNYRANYGKEQLVSYLKLAIKGIVEYPKFSQMDYAYNALIPNEEFTNIFKTYFIRSQDNYGVSNLPYEIKKFIIAFYESDEGKDYRYKIKGQKTSYDLIWNGELTGKGKNEFAVLFYNKKSNLEKRSMLLVFATKSFSGKNSEYYLVYHETFYNDIVLDHLKKSADGIDYVEEVYMGKETKEETEFDGVLIKQINGPDEVLVYNEEFDKMVSYIQLPPSKKPFNESSEENQEESD